jgi:hypothetical protein
MLKRHKFIRLLIVGLLIPALLTSVRTQAGMPLPTDIQSQSVEMLSQTEENALIALYNSTNGSAWIDNTDWLTVDSDPCTWFGITCTDGQVTTINLASNSLSGQIPSELGTLTSLADLHLNNNLMIGSIPPELGTLASLTYLNVSNNQLTGSIPPELGTLANLTQLDISGNLLTGNIPSELSSLANLTQLDISGNLLTGSIPPELGTLANLTQLDISGNLLTNSIPPELGTLSSLGELYLNSNMLTGSIPPELGTLASLHNLNLSNNNLRDEIPTSITSLTNLGQLDIGYNALKSSNSAVNTFLQTKSPTWRSTQTVVPTNIRVATITANRITLSWAATPYTQDGGYYEVRYATDSQGPYDQIGCITVTKATSGCTIKNLAYNTTYYFVVLTLTPAHPNTGQQNDLWSDESAPLSTTIVRAAPTASGPNDPPIRNAIPSIEVTLSWQPLTWAMRYQIQIAPNSTFTKNVTNVTVNGTSTTVTLSAEGLYYWRVQAQQNDTGKWGSWSAVDSFVVVIP